MTSKILLLRHAESVEDIDPTLRDSLPDKKIGLTDKGKTQVKQSLNQIAAFFNECHHCFVSPSNRALETHDMLSGYSFPDFQLPDLVVEPRIRSLNWGNTTSENRDQIERQRYEAGVLNYKFPGGENTPQFVDAIREFVDEFKQQFQGENALIITHGFALRVLVKAFVRMDDHSFRYLANPPNCFVVKLVQKPKSFGFALKSEMPKADPSTWIQ